MKLPMSTTILTVNYARRYVSKYCHFLHLLEDAESEYDDDVYCLAVRRLSRDEPLSRFFVICKTERVLSGRKRARQDLPQSPAKKKSHDCPIYCGQHNITL
jgi:hypothetical protein